MRVVVVARRDLLAEVVLRHGYATAASPSSALTSAKKSAAGCDAVLGPEREHASARRRLDASTTPAPRPGSPSRARRARGRRRLRAGARRPSAAPPCRSAIASNAATSMRDQLRLALLVVDAALHDERSGRLEQLARVRVHRVEHDAPPPPPVTSSSRRKTIGSPFFVVICLSDATIPPTRDDLAVAAALELGERAVRLAAQLVADRVTADAPRRRGRASPSRASAARSSRTRRARSRGWCFGAASPRVAEVEDRALAGEPVGLLAAAPRERRLEHLEHPLARRAGRVERAALDERLERALVRPPAGRRAR